MLALVVENVLVKLANGQVKQLIRQRDCTVSIKLDCVRYNVAGNFECIIIYCNFVPNFTDINQTCKMCIKITCLDLMRFPTLDPTLMYRHERLSS